MLFYFVIFCIIGFAIGILAKGFNIAIAIIVTISLCWGIVFGPWALATFIELILGYAVARFVAHTQADTSVCESEPGSTREAFNTNENLHYSKNHDAKNTLKNVDSKKQEFYLNEITSNVWNFLKVPEEMRTTQICHAAVQNLGCILGSVPEVLRTPKLCLIAVQCKSSMALQDVPMNLRTPELCLTAVQNHGQSLKDVPTKLRTPAIYLAAVHSYGKALELVPEELRTPELCLAAVMEHCFAIEFVPEEKKTIKLCLVAVQKNGCLLRFVPMKLRTAELCFAAIKTNGNALEYVPEDLKTPELYLALVKGKKGGWLNYVPMKFRTQEICIAAVQSDESAMEYVPEKLKTSEFLAAVSPPCSEQSDNSMPEEEECNSWLENIDESVSEGDKDLSQRSEENAGWEASDNFMPYSDFEDESSNTLKNRSDGLKKIIQEIEARKIKYLIHFTSIANLESILTNGFIPRYNLENDRVHFEFNDSERRDGRKDCTCFSIEYPNEFFMKRYKHKNLCVLRLNMRKVIQFHDGKIYYTIHNAATKMCRDMLSTNPDFLPTYKAFINIFREENPDTRYPYTRTEKSLKPYLPTNHQSEVLVAGKISSKFIDSVFFNSEEQFNKFIHNMDNVTLLDKFSYICNNFYFNSRDNVQWSDR